MYFDEKYDSILDEIKRMSTMKSTNSLHNIQLFNVPTLKSRKIIENSIPLPNIGTNSTPKKSRKNTVNPLETKKVPKKSWLRNFKMCFTVENESQIDAEEVLIENEEMEKFEKERKSEMLNEENAQMKRLNDLRLLTLSYEAEMEELQEEIKKLEKERSHLRKKSGRKNHKSTGKSPSKSSIKLNNSPTKSLANSEGRTSTSSGIFSELSFGNKTENNSLASVIAQSEDVKILYIC